MAGSLERNYLLTENDEVLGMKKNGKTISLKEAVGMVAIRTYADYVEYVNCPDAERKEGLKEKLLFQTKVLNSLSAALKSVT